MSSQITPALPIGGGGSDRLMIPRTLVCDFKEIPSNNSTMTILLTAKEDCYVDITRLSDGYNTGNVWIKVNYSSYGSPYIALSGSGGIEFNPSISSARENSSKLYSAIESMATDGRYDNKSYSSMLRLRLKSGDRLYVGSTSNSITLIAYHAYTYAPEES